MEVLSEWTNLWIKVRVELKGRAPFSTWLFKLHLARWLYHPFLQLKSFLCSQSYLLEEKVEFHYEFWLLLPPHCLLCEYEAQASGPPILSDGKKKLSGNNQTKSQNLLVTLFWSFSLRFGWSAQWLIDGNLGSDYHCFWRKDLYPR